MIISVTYLIGASIHGTTFHETFEHLALLPVGCHRQLLTLPSGSSHTTQRRESLQLRLSKLRTSRRNILHLSCL